MLVEGVGVVGLAEAVTGVGPAVPRRSAAVPEQPARRSTTRTRTPPAARGLVMRPKGGGLDDASEETNGPSGAVVVGLAARVS